MKKIVMICVSVASLVCFSDVACKIDTELAVAEMVDAWADGNGGWIFPRDYKPSPSNSVNSCVAVDRKARIRRIWVGRTESSGGIKWSVGFSKCKSDNSLAAEYRIFNESPVARQIICSTNSNNSSNVIAVSSRQLPHNKWLMPYETCMITQYWHSVKNEIGNDAQTNKALTVRSVTNVSTNHYVNKSFSSALALRREALKLKQTDKVQSVLDEAKKEFLAASSDKNFYAASMYELACIACLNGAYKEAYNFIEKAINYSEGFVKARVLKAYICRKLNKGTVASKSLRLARECDPLCAFAYIEESFLLDDGVDAVLFAKKQCGLNVGEALNIAFDYLWIGAHNEVQMLIKESHEIYEQGKTSITMESILENNFRF